MSPLAKWFHVQLFSIHALNPELLDTQQNLYSFDFIITGDKHCLSTSLINSAFCVALGST
jgi:hypothetical protein